MKTTDDQKELFVVVDENDKILGYKTRYECHHDKTLIHRGVDLVIFNNNGDLLLQKRSSTKDTNPGYWTHSVGGHVGKGESNLVAVRREVKEELGIELPVKFVSKFIFSLPRETEMESLYQAISNGPFYPNLTEVAKIEFMSKELLTRRVKSGDVKLTMLAKVILNKIGFYTETT